MRKILAVSVGLVMLAAACGSSGSSKSSGGSSNTSNDEFSALYGKAKDATIRVTYQNLDNSGNPQGDPWTVSQKGANQVAYIQKDSKVVVNGDTVTSCDNLQTQMTCQTVPGGQQVAQGLVAGYGGFFAAAATAITTANGKFGDKSTETVAGRSADCVTITAGSALGKIGGAVAKALGGNTKAGYTACVDKDTGFLLKWQVVGVDNDKSGTVASEVGQPQDSDFDVTSASTTSEGTGGTGETTTIGGGSETSTSTGGSSTPCPPITVPGSPITITVPPGVPCPGG